MGCHERIQELEHMKILPCFQNSRLDPWTMFQKTVGPRSEISKSSSANTRSHSEAISNHA